MANTKNFIAKNGVSTGDGYAMPDVRPSLLLDFANSKTLDPRITFTRGSTATYWDGHTTTKAEENLAKYSQDYSQSDWSKFNLTVTDDAATAPDGSTTAASLITNTANNNHYIAYNYGDLANVQVTQSWYAKANGYNHCFIGHGIGTTEGAWFNLSTGATGTVGGTITSSSITSVGNSWYRCSITYTVSQTVRYAIIAPTNADGTVSFTGDGTSGIYAWGAQVEQRSSATAYTATTSSPIVKYQPTLQTAASGEARFDHDPVTGESKGLLIEESRTNYDIYSDFSNGYGTSRVNYKADYAIAPDGTQSAIMLEVNEVGTVQGLWSNNYTTSLGTYYTTSVHVRKETNAELAAEFSMYIRNSIGSGSIYGALVWDTAAGFVSFTGNVATNATYKAEDLGDWWRLSITTNEIPTGDERTSFRMTSQPLGKRIILWGRQWEVGAFPTSYIPTSGSTVTRSNDKAEVTDLSWFTQDQGTVFTDISTFATAGVAAAFAINDGTGPRTIDMRLAQGFAVIADNTIGGTQAQFNHTASDFLDGEYHKYALAYQRDNFARAYDGANLATDTSGNVPTNLTRLLIGGIDAATVYWLNGHVAKFAFYPQRLSNATLQAMTEE